MGISVVGIFNAAVDQAQKSAQNLQAIREARIKRQQEQQMFDLKKKKMELDIKEQEMRGDASSVQLQTQKAMLDQYNRQQKSIFDGQNAQIDQVEHSTIEQGKQAGTVARTLFRSDPDVQSFVAQNINPTLPRYPAPAGMAGEISGVDAGQDNTPEAVNAPSALSNIPSDVYEPAIVNGKPAMRKGNASTLVNNRISALDRSGVPLLPDEARYKAEQEFKAKHPDYKRGQVVALARKMALDHARSIDAGAKNIDPKVFQTMIPKAEEDLYGESLTQVPESGAGGVSPIPKSFIKKQYGESSTVKDKYGRKPGEVFTSPKFPGQQFQYIGNGKAKRIK